MNSVKRGATDDSGRTGARSCLRRSLYSHIATAVGEAGRGEPISPVRVTMVGAGPLSPSGGGNWFARATQVVARNPRRSVRSVT